MRREELRKAFRECGESIRDWAARHDFDSGLVYAVISGRVRGDRGKAHHVAVALGLKRPPSAKDLGAHAEVPMT